MTIPRAPRKLKLPHAQRNALSIAPHICCVNPPSALPVRWSSPPALAPATSPTPSIPQPPGRSWCHQWPRRPHPKLQPCPSPTITGLPVSTSPTSKLPPKSHLSGHPASIEGILFPATPPACRTPCSRNTLPPTGTCLAVPPASKAYTCPHHHRPTAPPSRPYEHVPAHVHHDSGVGWGQDGSP